MRRRTLLKALGSGAAALSAPRLLRAETAGVLRFVPLADLAVLNPVWAGARPTRNHAFLVFDDPAIRRAVLGAISQTDAMAAVAGDGAARIQDRVGLFGQEMALASDAGIEVLTGPPDFAKVRRDLDAARLLQPAHRPAPGRPELRTQAAPRKLAS